MQNKKDQNFSAEKILVFLVIFKKIIFYLPNVCFRFSWNLSDPYYKKN